MFEKLLICLDGSSLAEQVLPYAAEVALRFGSKVILLQVITVPSKSYAAAAEVAEVKLRPGTQSLEEHIQRKKGESKAYLERVAKPLRESGLDVECVLMEGRPCDAIISYCDENQVNLVALTTRGRRGFKRLVIGSVADCILRRSGLPVLLVCKKQY